MAYADSYDQTSVLDGLTATNVASQRIPVNVPAARHALDCYGHTVPSHARHVASWVRIGDACDGTWIVHVFAIGTQWIAWTIDTHEPDLRHRCYPSDVWGNAIAATPLHRLH